MTYGQHLSWTNSIVKLNSSTYLYKSISISVCFQISAKMRIHVMASFDVTPQYIVSMQNSRNIAIFTEELHHSLLMLFSLTLSIVVFHTFILTNMYIIIYQCLYYN